MKSYMCGEIKDNGISLSLVKSTVPTLICIVKESYCRRLQSLRADFVIVEEFKGEKELYTHLKTVKNVTDRPPFTRKRHIFAGTF